jgi:hypothetical protein
MRDRADLEEAGLVRVQREAELGEPLPQCGQEPLGLGAILEAHDESSSGGESHPSALTTGRDTLASSGSYPPASGRTPSSHSTNKWGSRRAMRPNQCIDARSRRRNRVYFHRAHAARALLR